MAEIKDSQLIRDALGSPVPQYWDETSQMYIARTVDGSFADVDFSKVRLLRDKLGSPIPQLWDIETAKFVPGKGGANGEVTIESVPGLKEKLDETTATLADKAKKVTGIYNASDFGLKGDNTNDAPAFIDMLNSVPTGSKIQFGKGTYNLSSLPKPFVMPDKVLYFYGVGRNETILKGSVDKSNSINLMASFKIQGIQLLDWKYFELVKTASVYNFLTFKECKMVNCVIPAYCADSTIEVKKFTFNDNELDQCTSACRLTAKVKKADINFNNADNLTQTVFQIGSDSAPGQSNKVLAIGNRISNVTMSDSYRGMLFYANEIKISNNWFENLSFAAGINKVNYTMSGVYIRSDANLSTVENNTFRNIDGWSIQVKDSIGKVSLTNNHVINDNPLHDQSRGFHVSVATHINIDNNHFEGLKATMQIWCTSKIGLVTKNTIVNCVSEMGIRVESVSGGSITVKNNEVETAFKTGSQNYSIVGYSIPNGHMDISDNKIRNVGEKGTKYGIYILMGSDATPMRSVKITNNSIDNLMYGFGVRGSVSPAMSFLKIQHNDLFNTTTLFNNTHIATTEIKDNNNMIV